MRIVRINKYAEEHINAYAHVERIDEYSQAVYVSNMNMPFQGTFAGEKFNFDEVTFLGEYDGLE